MVGLRVVSLDDEATWQSPQAEPESAPSDAKAAAEWLAERLSRNGRAISRLVVDTDGGVCSWVSANDTSPDVIRALVEQPFDQDETQATSRFPEMPGETALELIGETSAHPKKSDQAASRLPLLAMPVVPARLLVDELDRLGIRIGEVDALWHVLADAWDPSARASLGGSKAERVIAETTPVTGIILLDPAGRLVWVWSRGGTTLAGGTQRLQTVQTTATEPDRLERGSTRQAFVVESDLGRLGTDWLSWSVQLGVAPTRVVIVGDPARVDDALDAGAIGRVLTRMRPDTPIDIVTETDPVGATLARLAGRGPRPGSTGISELTERPGRAHRAMYRWGAVALLCAAAAVGAVAWRLLSVGNGVGEQINGLQQTFVTIATDNGLGVGSTTMLDLELRIEQLRAEQVDLNSIEPPPPVLEMLESLSFILASDDFRLKELSISPLSITLKVEVDETGMYESLTQSLRNIAGPAVDWRSTITTARGTDAIEASFTGMLPKSEGQN